MATEKTYLASDNLSQDAVVTDVADFGDCQRVRLDRTLFHPQGGGQKADRGTINGLEVKDVRHAEEGEVDHLVVGGAFSVGQRVKIEVDHDWRKEGRRWHSAGHLLADIVTAIDPGLLATRGHHWPGEGRVEFTGDAKGLGALVEVLSQRIDEAIEADIPFQVVGDPHRSRALQIGTGKPVGCGGTHVSSAAALVGLTVRKVQQKEGFLRIGYSFADLEGA